MAVGARHRRRQDVSDFQVGRYRSIPDQDVARLAVLSHHRDGFRAVGVYCPREERLIATAVEHRAGVVAHTSVHRDVGADTWQPLDRSDRIQGYRRVGNDCSPGFGGHPCSDALGSQRVFDSCCPLGDRRCFLAVDVGDPQATTQRQFRDPVMGRQPGDHPRCFHKGLKSEDLAAYVGVDTEEIQSGRFADAIYGRVRRTRRDCESELGVVVAGGDVLVSVGFDPRSDTDQDANGR